MPNQLKQVMAGLVLALVALAPAAASAQTVDEIIARGKLIIAVDTTTPPYGFLDAELKPTGFDIEVANRMGEALGVPMLVGNAVCQLLGVAKATQGKTADITTIVKCVEEWAGVQVKG